MNVKKTCNIIIASVFAIVLSISIACCGVNKHRYNRANSELGRVGQELIDTRRELQLATNQQSIITAGLDECYELTRDTEAILNTSAATISGLREQIRIIRKNYEAMEDRLRYLRNINSNNNNSSNNNGE